MALLLLCSVPCLTAQTKLRVGSKNFPESVVLAELMAQVIEAETEMQVERRFNLGGTMVCWTALKSGEIDLYADYSGTGWAVLLKLAGQPRSAMHAYFEVRKQSREQHGVAWLSPLGFNNTYVLALREELAAELGIRRISDLLPHQHKIRAGFGVEFFERADGYPGLRRSYGLDLGQARVVEHGLAYEALRAGQIDMIDAYATDAKLARGGLRVLEDDRRSFPPYHAAPLLRRESLKAHPELGPALERLAYLLDERSIQVLNYLYEVEQHRPAAVCAAFLRERGILPESAGTADALRERLRALLAEGASLPSEQAAQRSLWGRLRGRGWQTLGLSGQHLLLSGLGVLLAALLAVPLGLYCSRRPALSQALLGAAGVLQTVPSLALLAFLIPALGLGLAPAVAALFLYALLPILRNTVAGIRGVDAELIDAARGMGLSDREILRHVELPLALPVLMAGLRTAAVVSVGVATLAAFVNAGGLGEPILQGLYLNDPGLILSGALPAAALAVLVDQGLGLLERRIQPKGLN